MASAQHSPDAQEWPTVDAAADALHEARTGARSTVAALVPAEGHELLVDRGEGVPRWEPRRLHPVLTGLARYSVLNGGFALAELDSVRSMHREHDDRWAAVATALVDRGRDAPWILIAADSAARPWSVTELERLDAAAERLSTSGHAGARGRRTAQP